MWKWIFGVLFCSLVFGGMAQTKKAVNKKAARLFLEAKAAFRAGKPEKALELLDKALGEDARFSDLYLLQADIYHKQGQKQKEITAIEAAMALDSLQRHPYYYFVWAELCFDEGAYAKALSGYRLYLEKDVRRQAAPQARRQIGNCEFAVQALQNRKKQPVELYYEAEGPVYWPALDITGETMLLTGQEGGRETMWMLQEKTLRPLHFDGSVNCGAPSLTADGQMMYFSLDRGGRSGFDLYVAYRLSDTVWSEPVNLGSPVNTDAWESQPAVSADGTKLYFASTREGGRGGSDIWFSRLLRREADGRQIWSVPRCLYLNTAGDEMAPFLYWDNRTLFFASDGYPGMGRKDVYKVDVEEARTPLNIGITVNTQNDEFGFIVDAGGKWGYFSSDRDGKRCICRYRLEDTLACPPAVYIRLRVEDEAGGRLYPDRLTVVDVERGDTLASYQGSYTMKQMLARVPENRVLLVNALKKGYLYYSDTLRLDGGPREEPLVYVCSMRRIRPEEAVVLKGLFFDIGDYRLRPESVPELQQLVGFLRLNPEVKIEISGHTDDTGEDGYNYRLSENRAFEVYKYLFLRHISKDRMSYKGCGKDRPLAPNDTESGRAKNRRTEIRIR